MLSIIHKLIFNRFKTFLFLASVFCGICGYIAITSNFNESVSDILPISDALIEEHELALEKFEQANTLYFSISAEEDSEKLPSELAENFSKTLSALPELSKEFHGIKNINFTRSIKILLKYAPYILDEKDIEKLQEQSSPENLDLRFKNMKESIIKHGSIGYGDALKNDPYGLMDVLKSKLEKQSGKAVGSFQNNAITSPDGKSVLLVASFNFDAKDSKKSMELVKKIDAKIIEFKQENPECKIAYSGAYRISADNAKMANKDSKICLLISTALMFLCCILAFKRRILVLFAIAPSAFGTLCSFAFIGVLYPSLSSIAIGFAGIAIGVTLDYAIHYIFHANAKNAQNLSEHTKCANEILKPTITGCATTIIAFAIMFVSGGKGFAQLGIFGAVGVAISGIASLAILPPVMAKLKPVKRELSVFDKLADITRKNVKTAPFFIFSLLITLAAISCIPHLKFDGRISSFSGLYEPAKNDIQSIKKSWEGAVSKSLILVKGETFDEALERNKNLFDALKNNGQVYNLDSISPLLPPQKIREENFLRYKNFIENLDPKNKLLSEISSKYKFNIGSFDLENYSLKNSTFENAYNEILESPFAAAINQKIKCDNKAHYIANLFNLKADTDRHAFRKAIGGGSPNIILADNALFEKHISTLAHSWMIKFLIISLCLVSLYVLFSLRNLKHAGIVILPVLLGLVWTFGAMAAFGINITLVNAIFVIFAVCIAEDYSVFFAFERMRGKEDSALQSVTVSALTTIVGFGILGFANHPVLKGLGQTAAISIFAILLANIFVAIPLARIFIKHEK